MRATMTSGVSTVRSRGLPVVCAALLVVAAASCGSDDDETIETDASGPEAPTESTVSDTATETPPVADGVAVDPDAVIRWQWATPAGSNYDPHLAFNQFADIYLYPAYDRLIGIDDAGELVPMLAEAWAFDDGGTTLRLRLRTDVVFHDGERFDADAVKANIERGQTLELSAVAVDLEMVREVIAVDDATVELHLAEPDAALPALLAGRAGMMISPAAFDNEDLDLFPVGAGPFQVAEHVPNAVMSFERFPDYWDPEVQTLGGVEIEFVADAQARLRSLEDGEAHGVWVTEDLIADAESRGLDVRSSPIAGTRVLLLNTAVPGLDDPAVRQAISLAIDREGLDEAFYGGTCVPSSQVLPTGHWAAGPDVEVDPYDPDTARALLDDAGYGDGLAIDAISPSGPYFLAQSEAIQAQLAEIGIEVSLTALDVTELQARFRSGEAGMYLTGLPGQPDPAKALSVLVDDDAVWNPGGYLDDRVATLLVDGRATTDPTARAEIYQELSSALAEDRFPLVLCNSYAVFAVSPAVQDISATFGGHDFRGVTILADE